MKASDLREKSVDDLKELEKSLAHDVFQNRLKNFTNRLDDTSSMGKTRRELARVTTLLREVEIGINRGPAATPADKAKPAPQAEAKAETKPKRVAPKKVDKAEGTTKKTKSAKKSEAKQS
jgi:large subunit ribosomal protein L29